MTVMNRRALLSTAVAAAATPAVFGLTSALASERPPRTAAEIAAAKDVTRILARYIVGSSHAALPADVRKQGVRTLHNWVGVAIGGSRLEAVNIAAAALAPYSGPGQASLLGRKERMDVMNAAFVNGVASHVLDYDDTHLKTIIHASSAVVPALLAYAELKPVSGQEFLNALVLGVETACRIGNAVYPDHYDMGWHITGTAGVFGAAAGVGRLMKLNEQQMVWALGLAASQPVGLRESFGSMNKPFNPGRTASNGLFSAILASSNFTSSNVMIESERGWAHAMSTKRDFAEITQGLGQRHEAVLNSYKPFPCGIVLHPVLDAAIQLQRENKIDSMQVESVALRVHPHVLELTGKTAPVDGLESKFSVYHAVAAALIEGGGGLRQFSDRAVRDPKIIALRQKVKPVVDAKLAADQCDMTITMKDGRKLHKYIEHAVGSVEVPMSDKDLDAKFMDVTDGVLPKAQCEAVMDKCWKVETLANAADIATAARATA
jgi:2-methylcitrate dehydratase PrpD